MAFAIALPASSQSPASTSPDSAGTLAVRAEQMRADCIQERRLICGKILKVLPQGLVVDSGYTSLLHRLESRSWLIPGSVAATREPSLIEGKEPEAVCVGLVFLTDLPRTRGRAAKPFDYVVVRGYPAGRETYTSVGALQKTIRRFACGLETAVKLSLEESEAVARQAASGEGQHPAGAGAFGLRSVRQTGAYLHMPESGKEPLPRLLSQTGAFADTARLLPSDGLLPYDIIFPFWSDGAGKNRWMAAPSEGRIAFSPTGEWTFPKGTVFVKHFEMPDDETRPESRRRLETRLLVCAADGGVYGATYKWRPDNSDAELLNSNLLEAIVIRTASGTRTQNWYYPSRQDCLVCHTRNAGLVLGVKTRQMNRDFAFPSGRTENELNAWNHLGLFQSNLDESELPRLPKLAQPDESSRSVEERARSYLDANCAHCHRPGGTVAFFDARYDTPLPQQSLVGGPVLLDEGIDGARAIAPRDIWRSILFMRVSSPDALKMPPLAHEVTDKKGQTLLKAWIESMPGPSVLPPPLISPSGGDFSQPLTVRLHEAELGTVIHYTLDGSKPASSDPIYEQEIRLTNSATLRARAFKPGFTKSITAQETFIISQSQ